MFLVQQILLLLPLLLLLLLLLAWKLVLSLRSFRETNHQRFFFLKSFFVRVLLL